MCQYFVNNIMSVKLLRYTCFLLVAIGYCHAASNSSHEHRIRALLLDNYDKNVLPAQGGREMLIEFGLKLNKLVKVDNKDQLVTIDTWIIMKWNNSFFKWNKQEYGGRERVHFRPSEAWFPDVALFNNGDTEIVRAGGTEKFVSNVAVENNGLCIWSGPAIFTASCEMKLKKYPFDHQQCDFRFGSFSYASNQLKLIAFKTKKSVGDRFLASGDWDLTGIKTKTGLTDQGNCCPHKFSEVVYTFDMFRRSQYQMFYLVAPCMILAVLALVSFWIPSESGERIGFVTTLLLGMMVFLLLIPESLPESSKSIPLLGILMMGTMVMIGGVLLGTIMVLALFFSKRNPSACIRKLFGPKSAGREAYEGDDNNGVSHINLRAVSPFKEEASSSRLTHSEEDNETTWQNCARAFDRILFWVFLIATIVMYAVVMTMRD